MKRKGRDLLLVLVLTIPIISCSLFTQPVSTNVTGLSISQNVVEMDIGDIEYITTTIKPSSEQNTAIIKYDYDSEYIDLDGDNSGFTISAKKAGNTIIKTTCNGFTPRCLVTISGNTTSEKQSPEITSSTIALELENKTSKQVQVSLTGGTSADMSNFSWYIDKSEIATIEAAGQTAYINGKQNGVAQVTVTHPLATYPYTFTVFVKPDAEKSQYITTSQNILSLKKIDGEKQISVSLMNGEASDLQFFEWEKLSNDLSDPDCVSIETNGQNCIITPLKQGTTFLQVSHPKTNYPLIIRVRVITILENVYIEPNTTQIILEGLNSQTLTGTLKGTTNLPDNSNTEFTWEVEDSDTVALIPYENKCVLKGLKDGKTKIKISHPLANYTREVLVFVQNHPASSIDGAMYLTTTQNYIRTKIGAEDTILNVSLVGGSEADINDFTWSVDNPNILSLKTTNGTIVSRAIFTDYSDGKALITPKTEGTAIITVTHSKAISPIQILVKVYSKKTLLENPAYITGESLLKILTGESVDCKVSLYGNITSDDTNKLAWHTETNQNLIDVVEAGDTAHITANNSGQTYISVSHPKVISDKRIIVVTAETQEELDNYNLLYAQKYDYNLLTGSSTNIYLDMDGLDNSQINNIEWETADNSILFIEPEKTVAKITGLSAGEAIVKVSSPDCSKDIYFNITVYPEGTNMGVLPSPVYLTTQKNVFQLENIEDTETVKIVPIGLSPDDYSNISFTVLDDSICSIIPNGEKATITAKKIGETTIKVQHEKSENYLTLTVRVGKRYISNKSLLPYIETSQDVVGLVCNESGKKITAILKNCTNNTQLNWSVDNNDIVNITPNNDYCFIEPKLPGQAQITITNTSSNSIKHVLVLVANSKEDLLNIPYLTTSQNLILLKNGSQQNVSVNMVNKTDIPNTYDWTNIDNNGVVDIIQSRNTASIIGEKIGIAHIQITNSDCVYPLEIVVQVKDSLPDAANNPYITTNNNIITLSDNSASKLINVTLVGGTDTDNKNFTWNYDQSQIITMVPNGNNCYIKPLKTGECCLTVNHPKAAYSFPIKIIVQASNTDNLLYIKTNPSNIITLKPADSEITVTATLIGGKEEDAYGFTWYSDNYNCIDFTANANTAVITPKTEGKATITVKHPKAGFPSEIQVRITEYSEFEFATSNITTTEGKTQFISMHVPSMDSSYDGIIKYETDNPKVVTITGTNKVAQITAVAAGTAVVSAISPSGAKSTLMCYVKRATENTLPYITSSTNVISMDVNNNDRSISAQLIGTGVEDKDQHNLEWKIDDPSVAKLIGTLGSNILLRPLKAGETTLTISHSKTDSIYSIHIDIVGSDNEISIDKTFLAINTGKTAELNASIDRASSAQYKEIKWSAQKVNGVDIVEILGSGKTISVYALAAGETVITAEYNGKTSTCEVKVTPSRQFYFETKNIRIQPGETKTVKYTVVPYNAEINWITNTNEYIEIIPDAAGKNVSIRGKEVCGNTQVIGSCLSGSASLSITTAWDYQFNVNKIRLSGEPNQTYTIDYTIYPVTAEVSAGSTNIADIICTNNFDGTGSIKITPKEEGCETISLHAKNKNTIPTKEFATKNISLNFSYSNLTLTPSIINQTGNFSREDSNNKIIIIGDGESATFGLGVLEKNANYTITDIQLNPKVSNSKIQILRGENDTFTLNHSEDIIEKEYLVDRDCWFEYNGNRKPIIWKDEHSGYHLMNWGFNWKYCEFAPAVRIYSGRPRNNDNATLSESYAITTKDINGNLVTTYINIPALPSFVGAGLALHEEMFDAPKFFSKKEFENNTDWYVPARKHLWRHGPSGCWSHDNRSYYDDYPAVLINRWAKLVPVIDKKITSFANTDTLTIIYRHNGKTKKTEIPVYLETRKCDCNQ